LRLSSSPTLTYTLIQQYRIQVRHLIHTAKMLFSVASIAAAFIASAAATAVPEWDQWAHGRVLVNNITLHYRWAGSGPPFVLVHGNPQHSVSSLDPREDLATNNGENRLLGVCLAPCWLKSTQSLRLITVAWETAPCLQMATTLPRPWLPILKAY
jgi:hypothetical protein